MDPPPQPADTRRPPAGVTGSAVAETLPTAVAEPELVSPPGYEILGELGRGGMGVVFRARQLGANRDVALKMVSAGDADAARRFVAECEIAASLEHAGIVPVYHVGRHAGQPFFAMKLVPGGSLPGQLAHYHADPRAAAGLVARVARAVQYAHERGVLHRDLKPANILLDADGSPLVADFGLAKRLDGGPGVSLSGAVLGTPSYMAPEQAAGVKVLTTAADVYGVGAILYELLAGRPPFRGLSALETLRQVIDDPPPRPRAFAPGVDAVLELVCLKCLEKSPADRYPSAAALADDLEKWAAGDPVSVRPPSAVGVLRAWLRQNFGSAGWSVVGGVAAGLVGGAYTLLELAGAKLAPLADAYDRLPGVPRPGVPTPHISVPVLAVAETAMNLATPALILVTTVLARPKNRSADVLGGLVYGVTAAVVFFAAAFGWWSVYSAAVVPGGDDFDLIAGPDADMLAAYPGLRGVPEADRRRVLLGKARFDLALRVPVGILSGLGLAAVLTVPLAVGLTCVAGGLRRRCDRLRSVVPLYFETALPGMVGFAAAFLVVQRLILYQMPPQHPESYALHVGLCGAAVLAAADRRRWPVRAALAAAWAGHYAVTSWLGYYEF